ncbi:MAG: tRNA (adenosine(37)-N6)-threonylcarbamoyltransferase complex ATPase subunit type 1 TsaE [Deltaproteobacteria bacterium]|nr:tRNA (adenosine(37)-N6)-threonylcarbamoyltransferase complex ATPase subunit type 1 TsaE [Deltaproteobacteria bacterium]
MECARFSFEGPRGAVRCAGVALGQAATAGAVIALEGPLGAGKTTLTQSIARGLAVPVEQRVTSPTFAIVLRHAGRVALYHADLYRLASVHDVDELGLFAQSEDGVLVIEWPERASARMPADVLWIELERVAPLRRRLSLRATGPSSADLVHSVETAITAREALMELGRRAR